MSDCEWNPAANAPALHGDEPHAQSELVVGANGDWHVCRACAELPFFRGYTARTPLEPVEEPEPVASPYLRRPMPRLPRASHD